ncbi:MAG: amidohydrolase family protein [Candidatus Eremiobacteraeota bacterium]|nr:amidohydrolase family protein [Candidatus Eremiobacteraeota bacterium]MBV8499962.1 amidohydrolase family protein [Candidatus Eremiobacteraeota bacterium]
MAPLIVRARTVITCDTEVPQCGITFDGLGRIDDAAVVVEDGFITAVGPASVIRKQGSAEIDVRDCVIVPGFVDAHAHPLFAGDREPDFAARLRGEPPPLGMAYTIERTRQALLDPAEFYERTVAPRLRAIFAHGTTTLECKTGYALHKPGETALLDLIAAHRDDANAPRLVPTFLGAHALPPEFTREEPFVDYLIDQVIPAAAAHGAVYADAFCEPGFFSPEQTRRYLDAARLHGMRLRVHCDEMAYGGAAEMAAGLGVDAVDHCNYIRKYDVGVIAERGIVTVACPATIAYLDLPKRAPVRELLEAGGAVALGSDYNPGTSPCFNLQTVAYFGRKIFGLSAAEALYGVTRAAAHSVRADAGRIAAGAAADFVALQIGSPDEFGWQFGGNLAALVVKDGIIAHC